MSDWQPYWLPSHTYALLAVVIPTTFTGYTWRCTTAGTSGNSEPSWPTDPSVNPTVNDNGLIWTVGTGFRQAAHDALGNLLGIVGAFAVANPTIIRSVTHTKPLSFTNAALPCFFLGDMNESLTHMNGVRQRVMDGFSGYLVDQGDPRDIDDHFNFAVDALTDLFSANYHAISGRSIFQHTATLDTEFTEGNAVFTAVQFSFALTNVMEGRI